MAAKLAPALAWLWAAAQVGRLGLAADLSGLVSESLALNAASNHSAKPEAPADWSFERVEYDLIEFLAHLSARYNRSAPPTPAPGPPQTSLAGQDEEPAESGWQYGIFDRFTRARPPGAGAGSTTRDPFAVGEPGVERLDVRHFNADHCGLRTYSPEPAAAAPADQLAELPEPPEPDLDLIQRRQRVPPPNQAHRKYQLESAAGAGSEQRERDAYNSFAAAQPDLGPLEPPSAELQPEADFNLSSRRYWFQQQLGNTLQMLNQSAPAAKPALGEPQAGSGLNATSGQLARLRENMMKMSAKSGRQAEPAHLLEALAARQDELKLEARVIGGTDARLGDSPWSVSLQALVARPGTGGLEYRHYCGGTIVGERYVLTAAHCLDFMVGRESRLFVVSGDLNWRMAAASPHGRRFAIERLIIHGGYKSTAFGHDIGLIRTKEPMRPLKVRGRYVVNSVCLPERNSEHSGEAELVGWGLFSNRNEMAERLQIADVPILPRPLCVDLYRRRTGLIQWLIGIELITDKQVCAGTFGRGICQGDSGSALVYNERPTSSLAASAASAASAKRARAQRPEAEETRATIIGVVAFGGIRRCSYQSLPGVYMQTSKYLDWILPRIQD